MLRHVDWLLLAGVGALVAYGLFVLEAVTRRDVPGDPDYFLLRQAVAVGIGTAGLVACAALDVELLRRARRLLYAGSVGSIALVYVVGIAARGSKRWIELGFFRFQPSELGKVLLALALAGFLADRVRRVGEWRTTLMTLALAALPAVLVFKQPDFGTALIYGAVVLAALFFAGARWSQLATIVAGGLVVALAILWFLPTRGVEILAPYQVDRIVGFLHPDADPSGSTYNVNQSITAVGSGGLDGRGVAGATQTNLNYLPEHNTDFIFSALAEQRGFLGAALLLGLYALVVWRGVRIVAVATTLFSATVAGTLTVAFLAQLFVNVGMTIGVAPITGIPLPLVSYGGSSMIATLLAMGILESIHIRGRLARRR